MELKLNGKTAIVDGDGGLTTVACGVALAEAGANVVFTCSTPETAMFTDTIRAAGTAVLSIPTDTTSAGPVGTMVDKVLARFGGIDLLVNNACVMVAKPFLELNEGEWRRVLDANATSAFLCTKAVAPHMLRKKKGRIINIVSGLAAAGMSNASAYCASLGAVQQLTRALAIEWANAGVGVNAIALGWLAGQMDEPDPDMAEKLARYIPMKRRAHPREFGDLLVYLASDASDYVTGQTMFVDGGLSVRP